jgi:hypothetical protein
MSDPKHDRDAVAARAYALYVRRGRQPGRSMEDWFEAERQVRAERGAPASDLGAPRNSLAGQAVPPRALPEAKSPPAFAMPPKAPTLPAAFPATVAPARLAPAAPSPAPRVAPAPAAKVPPAPTPKAAPAPASMSPSPARVQAPKPSEGGKKRRKK